MKIAATLLVALCGCSFVMTDRPKPPPQDPGCSRSYAPVVLDIVGAFVWPGVVGLSYAAASVDDLDDEDAITTAVFLGIGTFVAEVISAGVGISRVGDCKDAYRARGAYPYYPYPPQPYYPQPPPYYPQPQQPPPPEPPRGLGIEGDACVATQDCAAGLTCQATRCSR